MADDFQSGICSGGSWWNPARSASFDVPACSTAAGDHKGGGTFGAWATSTTDLIGTAKAARSCDDQSAGSASGSSLSFQDKTQTTSDISHPLMDSTLQLPRAFGLSSVSVDWPQASFTSGGRTESSFHALLQEDLNSRSYAQHDPTMIESINRVHIDTGTSLTNPFKDMTHNYSMDQQYYLSSGNNAGSDGVSGYALLPASYGCSPTSTPLQALLLEPEGKGAQQAIYDNLGVSYQQFPMMAHRGSSSDTLQQPSWSKFSQLVKSSPLRQQPGNQLQFSNNTPFWNASAVITSSGEGRTGFYSPTAPPQFTAQSAFEPKPAGSNLIAKANQEATFRSDSCSSSSTKNNGGEPAFKKPRMEALSPLPTFKVRKEKLGDRITALQQLVSPFGKTDTASVLHEAIEYIKFLHDQVGVLSTPYLKSGHPTAPQQGSEKSNDSERSKKDLRSRGLCLVPIASTYPVASQTTADFWHPTFGGTFRITKKKKEFVDERIKERRHFKDRLCWDSYKEE